MSQKKTDLARMLASKLQSQTKAGASQRFGAAAPEVLDRRERRRQESAAGLVACACKLPSRLVDELRQQAASHPEGLNGLVAERLERGRETAKT